MYSIAIRDFRGIWEPVGERFATEPEALFELRLHLDDLRDAHEAGDVDDYCPDDWAVITMDWGTL